MTIFKTSTIKALPTAISNEYPEIIYHCDVAGCHTTLVIDGNMKNHRNVCKAKDAGYVEFEGLQGLLR